LKKSDVRLGSSGDDAKEIKNHPFFKNIEWEILMKKSLEPPYKPILNGKKDLSHFSKVFSI
jgi:protein-serine/threonine kinase